MIKATNEILKGFDELWEKRKAEILNTKDNLKITGTAYYVSNGGDDNNDGKSPETAWKTLNRVTEEKFLEGDGVFFKRGDLFRGCFYAKTGVAYGAYGEGEKPKFYSGKTDYAKPELWELYDGDKNVWKLKEKILEVGGLVFNHGKRVSRKLIPSFKGGKFVCRDNPTVDFDMVESMTEDLDIFWFYMDELTEDLEPVPKLQYTMGDFYLRCDKGNPGEVFDSIEALVHLHAVWAHNKHNVIFDNLCFKYYGMHGIASGGDSVENLVITNCEFGFIGGSIQHFNSNHGDECRRGMVTRFGNAIEIYGGCKGYIAKNNYIYEIYDAAVTHQVASSKKLMQEDIDYSDNLIDKCVYGIEYFLGQSGPEVGKIKNCSFKNNFIRNSGYGWGQQRPDPTTPAAIKSWEAGNPSQNYTITDNIFDRAAYHFIHITSAEAKDLPFMDNNTYIQNIGGPIGKFGAYKPVVPKIEAFTENADEYIKNVFGDKNAKVYYID